MSSCSLWGSIPSSLTAMTALTSLFLSWNGLGGSLPVGIGALNKLVYAEVASACTRFPGQLTTLHAVLLTTCAVTCNAQEI